MSGAMAAIGTFLVGDAAAAATATAAATAATSGIIGTAGSLTMAGAASAALTGLSALQALGTIGQGNAQRAMMDSKARQEAVNAGQDRATAQRVQYNELQKGAYAESRANALQSASGADPNSVTAMDNIGHIAGNAEYGALTALFNGEQKARGQEFQSQSDYAEGAAAHTSGVTNAAGQFASSMGSIWGPKLMGPPTTAATGSSLYTRFADMPKVSAGNAGDAIFSPLDWDS